MTCSSVYIPGWYSVDTSEAGHDRKRKPTWLAIECAPVDHQFSCRTRTFNAGKVNVDKLHSLLNIMTFNLIPNVKNSLESDEVWGGKICDMLHIIVCVTGCTQMNCSTALLWHVSTFL